MNGDAFIVWVESHRILAALGFGAIGGICGYFLCQAVAYLVDVWREWWPK